MALHLTIISPGRTKENWLKEALKDYEKRLTGSIEIAWNIPKDDKGLLEACHSLPHAIALDPNGKTMDSEAFARWLKGQFEERGSRLSFLIGGAEGLPSTLPSHFVKISLSSLTFTHQMTRLVLLEQLYRAAQIWKGSPYHKS